MVDRDPVKHWTFGHVTLLGDAAHPMYPRGSNGASQSILDAATLSECLAQGKEGDDWINRALQKYEEIRIPPCSAIVLANRSMGPEAILELVEQRAPNGFKNLDDVVTKEELAEIIERYSKLAGFDRERLEARKKELKASRPDNYLT
jgi:2-polyprenyl-6-methoxyphenol hydroxylase-like FAD-dependent oxidoreductase